MDVQLEHGSKKRWLRRSVLGLLVLGSTAWGGWRLTTLKPADPAVEHAALLIESVKRGSMVREVHGAGTLVPEDIVWIQAAVESEVSRIGIRSGDAVRQGDVLVVLVNPQLAADAEDAVWQENEARASYDELRSRLQTQVVEQHAAVSNAQADAAQAQTARDLEEELFAQRLEAEMNVKAARAKSEQAKSRFHFEEEKLKALNEGVNAQLHVQQVQIDKFHAAAIGKKERVRQLTIRAAAAGRIQEMNLQVGQRVKPGDVLAKVSPPGRLLAQLQIPETQAKDILVGQHASIDTHNGTIPAHVTRIDASIVNGTRTIDCTPDAPLPPGAVPDLSVDGIIEIERLRDVTYIARPPLAQPNTTITLFKIDADGTTASRVNVRIGRVSVSTAEVLNGLAPGDQIILSDVAAQDHSRIRLQ